MKRLVATGAAVGAVWGNALHRLGGWFIIAAVGGGGLVCVRAVVAERTYLAIDLKSFFASVECVERGWDPLDKNLVVADLRRTSSTICLAVSPALRSFGVGSRFRLFEVEQTVALRNAARGVKPGGATSDSLAELQADPSLGIGYQVFHPRMNLYIETGNRICSIYEEWVAAEDIYRYSIDEVFIDITGYLRYYGCSSYELASKIVNSVLEKTGITATAGIGPNIFLSKIAMDIIAKRLEPDANGARVAELDTARYHRELWNHRPIDDFWMVGRATANRLAELGLYTMEQVAKFSEERSDALFRVFGVNATELINHAWGRDPSTVTELRNYDPEHKSRSAGQLFWKPMGYELAKRLALEMVDALSLELARKDQLTTQLIVEVQYDQENLADPTRPNAYQGATKSDHYGREVPKPARGSYNFDEPTASYRELAVGLEAIFERYIDRTLTLHQVNVMVGDLIPISEVPTAPTVEQGSLFDDPNDQSREKAREARQKDYRLQKAVSGLTEHLGKQVIHKAISYLEGSTGIERSHRIHGHHE